MNNIDNPHIRNRLTEGWAIAGYSTSMFAAGAMQHNVLLQKETKVEMVTIVVTSSGWSSPKFTVGVTTFA